MSGLRADTSHLIARLASTAQTPAPPPVEAAHPHAPKAELEILQSYLRSGPNSRANSRPATPAAAPPRAQAHPEGPSPGHSSREDHRRRDLGDDASVASDASEGLAAPSTPGPSLRPPPSSRSLASTATILSIPTMSVAALSLGASVLTGAQAPAAFKTEPSFGLGAGPCHPDGRGAVRSRQGVREARPESPALPSVWAAPLQARERAMRGPVCAEHIARAPSVPIPRGLSVNFSPRDKPKPRASPTRPRKSDRTPAL